MFCRVPPYGFLKDEFEMNMRLLGARTIKDVVPEMVDASNIHSHIVAVPGDRLYDNNCEYPCVVLRTTTIDSSQIKVYNMQP